MKTDTIKNSRMTLKLMLLSTAISVCLHGCILFGPGIKEEPLPREIAREMNELGATIVSRNYAWGDLSSSVKIDSTVTPTQVISDITLFIAPKPTDNVSPVGGASSSILQEEALTLPYRFTFSAEVDGKFLEIPPSNTLNRFTSTAGSYGGHLMPWIVNRAFHGEGNYVLTTGPQLRIPVTATHIELWFQEDTNAEREFVRRVPLESFSNWRKLFQDHSDTL